MESSGKTSVDGDMCAAHPAPGKLKMGEADPALKLSWPTAHPVSAGAAKREDLQKPQFKKLEV